MRRVLRGALGLLLGLGVVASLPTYAGLSISFFRMLARGEVPIEYRGLYVAMALYCLAVGIFLILLSVLTFAQFATWRIVTNRVLSYGLPLLLATLAIVHFAALGVVGDVEERSLFIASSIPYAVLLITIVEIGRAHV